MRIPDTVLCYAVLWLSVVQYAVLARTATRHLMFKSTPIKVASGVVFLIVCSIMGDTWFQPSIRTHHRRDETKTSFRIK